MPNTTTRVALVIPCFQEENYIRACVLSCLNQITSASVKVYVVDGGSTDGTLDILSEIQATHSNLTILHNEKRVTPISLNMGLQASDEDYKMILGAHAELPSNYIETCLSTFQQQPDASCVGGLILNSYENSKSEAIGLAMSSSFGVGNAHFRTGNQGGYVDTVAFGMYKREVFEAIGYFNEALVRNQDDEFNFRMQKNHLRIYLNTHLTCNYFVRSKFSKLLKQYYQYGYWKVYVNQLHKQITTVRQLVPFAFVCYLILAASLTLALPRLWLVWCSPLFLYLVLGGSLAMRIAKEKFPYTWLSFLILHLGYGSGYLKGVIELLIFNKKPTQANAQHNR